MSLATLDRTWQNSRNTRTVRHFWIAVAFALAAIVCGVLLYGLENVILGLEHPFVENPASVMMRAVGLGHFWVGWLFLFTSPRLRNRPALCRLLGWTLLGVVLCVLCGQLGALRNPFIFIFFYGYFLVHEIRDQANLYRACGDAPLESDPQFLLSLRTTAIIAAVSLLSVGYVLHGLLVRKQATLLAIAPSVHGLLFGILLLACAAALVRTGQLGQRQYGSLGAACREHGPLVSVYLGLLSVLLLGLVLGAAVFNLIILIHAGAWLVFVYHQLQQRSAPTRLTLWTWLRYTPTGFLVLHLSVIALVLVFMALRVHLWHRVGFVSELFEGANFPYWSLMHISMAFWKPAK